MNSIRKTSSTVSQAVKEYLDEVSLPLESASFYLVGEKVFIDKKEYTVECCARQSFASKTRRYEVLPEEDAIAAKEIMEKLLSLMRFMSFTVEIVRQPKTFILRINTQGKNGLLIGKNGQNIIALQYLLSAALDKTLRRHAPVLIDIDSYIDKRSSYLCSMVKNIVEKASLTNSEVITELLPSNERKLIHEELKDFKNIKTFSIGKGSYKKVVITPLL